MPTGRSQVLLLDVLAAVALGALGLLSLVGGQPGARTGDLLGAALVVVGAAAVAWRQRLPLTVLAVTAGTSLALLQLDYHQAGGGLTVLWALHAAASRRPLRVAAVAAAATLAAVQLVLTTAPAPATVTDRISTTLILGAGWGLGLAGRGRRERFDALEARASAERAASRAEQRAVLAEERAVIAREMQDLVAHDLAEVTVQVAAARRMVARDPGAAEALLADAEGAARTVVAEVRRILALLTDPGLAPAPGDHRPLPGLADLGALVASAAASGPEARLVVAPDVDPEAGGPVAAGPGLLAYRLVERALDSAAGAGARAVTVDVSRPGAGLRVEVHEEPGVDGPRTLPDLETLRRRAELYGGHLEHAHAPVPAHGRGAGTRSLVLEIPVATSRSRQ